MSTETTTINLNWESLTIEYGGLGITVSIILSTEEATKAYKINEADISLLEKAKLLHKLIIPHLKRLIKPTDLKYTKVR